MLHLFYIPIARARIRIFGFFTAKNIERGLDNGACSEHNLQASVAELRSFVKPFSGKTPHNFTGNRETVMFCGTGGLCL